MIRDDDNDGVNDFAANGMTGLDFCPRGVIGWRSDSVNDRDGDGCRDSDEDAFETDPCASTDTDSDGKPDALLAGCATPLEEDTDDDNDGLNDLAVDGSLLDRCPQGVITWRSDSVNDRDGGRLPRYR